MEVIEKEGKRAREQNPKQSRERKGGKRDTKCRASQGRIP
jgi:hypothetical protein